MSSSIPPSGTPPPTDVTSSQTSVDSEEFSSLTERGFAGMKFSEEEWKQFLNSLAQSISREIQRQEKRAKEASQKLKESIEGN